MNSNQHKFSIIGILAISLGLIGVLSTVSPAKALTISPPSIEFTVQPGNQAEFIVKLYNESTEKQQLHINATTFTSSKEDGVPSYDFSVPKEDIATWIKYDTEAIILEPQGRKEATITVDVPADAAPGGHYGVVGFITGAPTTDNGATPQVAISQGAGTLLLVRVEGEVVESASVSAFNVTKEYSHLPVSFTTIYQNTGNIHLKPTGTITITGMTKKVVATLNINPTKTSTLPKTSRTYEATWGDASAVKAVAGNVWSKFWESYSNERSNFAIGKYTASLALTAGQTGSVVSNAEVAFWVFPWHVILVWGIGIIVVIILLIILVKRYNHWVVSKAQNSKSQTAPKDQVPPKGTN